jgi:hypothetical protein
MPTKAKVANSGDSSTNTVTYDDDQQLSYDEVCAVAHEIYKIEQRVSKIRTGVFIAGSVVVGAIIFIVVLSVMFASFEQTQVQEDKVSSTPGDKRTELSLVSKESTEKILKTAESLEDTDASNLIAYEWTSNDTNGDPEGEWIFDDAKLSMIRTISWKEGQEMHVHHIAEVRRQDGDDCHVNLTTKAKHIIRIWDSAKSENASEDNYNIEILQWFPNGNSGFGGYGEWTEVLPDSDEDGQHGSGRALISMRADVIADSDSPRINFEDYWCNVGDQC